MHAVRTAVLLAISVAVSTAPALSQERQRPKPSKSDDILVEGLVVPGQQTETQVTPGTNQGVKNRTFYENSQRVAKCAFRTSLPMLREAIDGAPNSSRQRQAQAWLIRQTTTCNADPSIIARSPVGFSQSAGITTNAFIAPVLDQLGMEQIDASVYEYAAAGTSIYDRGALLERMLDLYAPETTLTREQTSDPVVQGRFNLRESLRNGYRLKADLDYFKAAVCMVRMEPKLAVTLYKSRPGSSRALRVRSAILNNARICVGNAKKVYVDATQFRIYIMDAMYRWMLAARDVPSFLPSADMAVADDREVPQS